MIYADVRLNDAVWIDVPPFWGGESWRDEIEWAAEVAENCWKDFGIPYQKLDLDRLSALLAECANQWGPGSVHPEHSADPSLQVHVVLHLPDPRLIPLPVRILVADANAVGGSLPSLRQLAMAEDPDAMDTPDVAEVQHPSLEPGLRVLRHREPRGAPGQTFEFSVYAVLRFVFPIPSEPAALIVDATWPDLHRLAAAQGDIHELVMGISCRRLG